MKKKRTRSTVFRRCELCHRKPSKAGKSLYCSARCEAIVKSREIRQNYKGRQWHRNRLFASDNICGICKEPILEAKEATIDHIIPISKGGADDITNMQLAHRDCNLAKGNQILEENK